MAPTLILPVVRNLCSLGPRAQVATGFFVQWMRQHFTAASGIEDPDARGLLWRAVDSTDILIESITTWKPSTTGKRPAIIVGRNDWEVVRFGVNDEHMGTIPRDGARHFSCVIKGSHTLFCLSQKGPEAEIVAGEVYGDMMKFGPQVREDLDLKRFVVVGAGKPFRVEEARSNYAVPVTVAYMAEENWLILPHAPFLKKIQLSLFLP
jgi:hypothetical protein